MGLTRDIVERYTLETGSEQGFGIGEKVARHCVDRPDDAAVDIDGVPDLQDMIETHLLACTFQILRGIVMQALGYCQVLELP
ncbi:hypothetical protein J8I29_26705 [Labrys sp. LIt4]|uniref:hypothetical protein n=1 Tax=Labrys sp. LIt4 TaxID=2821355 RepID=UPI001ADFD6F0|nr:hypothetical protein [Labrys sp. LIt4]MBP0582945.1 hypothetical protein [Labrys sp. LIt4]